eukprot:TRINITY_DN13302_c0_g1_i1.p1 TRINITY_DN13302_c0_g1~~TRINITY_DN13302_c0_g1_i1.p1  ORF type:complete len:579 (+),score=46.03 TRINITY_DN13302_c0_g1_i1:226-1962(+)
MYCHEPNMFPELDDEGDDKEFICPIGSGVFKDPVALSECGHTFCRVCITKWCKTSATCPIDRKTVNPEKIVPNWTVFNYVNKKKVACCTALIVEGSQNSNVVYSQQEEWGSKEGQHKCDWEGQLQQLLSHRQKECLYEIIGCKNENCKEVSLERRELIEHNQICPHRLIRCEFCENDSIKFIEKQAHDEICPEKLIECPLQCMTMVKKSKVEDHLQKECKEMAVECPMRIGCGKTFKRHELGDHLLQNLHTHYIYFTDTLTSLKCKVKSQKKNFQESSRQLDEAINNLKNQLKHQQSPALYAIGGDNGKIVGTATNCVKKLCPNNQMNMKWIQEVPIGTARYGHAAVAFNGKMIILGGTDGQKYFDSIEIYDPAIRSCCMGPPMLSKRYGLAAAVFNNRIYVFGGYDGKKFLNSVEYFDQESNRWNYIKTCMSEERIGHVVAVLGKKIYVFGGTTKTVECYDPRYDQWANVAPMSTERDSLVGAVLDGCVYAIGGSRLRTVERYNPRTNTWSNVAEMSIIRRRAGSTVNDGKIYVAGGSVQTVNYKTCSVEIYDPATDQWSLTTPMPEACDELALLSF